MTINGINGTNAQMGQMGMDQATDSYSRNIQNQIADAQKQLQELSSNKHMTQEEKMMKRQELQQQAGYRCSRYGSDHFSFNIKRAD